MAGKIDGSGREAEQVQVLASSFFTRYIVFPTTVLPAVVLISACLVTAGVGFPGVAGASRGQLPVELVFSGHSGTNGSHVLLVDKASQHLLVYRQGTKGFEQVAEFHCSTGKAQGAKQRSGDQRTPEGIYFFVKKHQKKDLAPIYGNLAFPMDYPNQVDRQAGRSGYAIWLHGTNKPLKPRDSNGCVVVENSTIDYLAGLIRLYRTPIIITPRLQYREPSAARFTADEIRAFLTRWRGFLAKGSYAQYHDLYAEGQGPNMGWWSRWCALRRIPGDGYRHVDIEVADLAIYKAAGLICVTFDQVLIYKGRKIAAGRKKMFFASDGQELRIIAESYLGPLDRQGNGREKLFAAMEEIGNG